MRQTIKEIQRRLEITTVYVTHDQEEAMAISDRIAVMKDGVIQHIGKPKDIYQRPANLFVASFIGRTNLLDAVAAVEGGRMVLTFKDGFRLPLNRIKAEHMKGQNVIVSIRPEEFVITDDPDNSMKGVIDSSVFLGLNTHYFIHLDSGAQLEIVSESKIDEIIPEKSRVFLNVKAEKINVFTEDGSRNILEGVNNDAEAFGEA